MKTTILLFVLFFGSKITNAQDSTVLSPGFTAVALAYTPDSAMVFLKGKATIDSRSIGQIGFKWFLNAGTASPFTIDSPDSLGTRVRGLIPGNYNFGFIVNDLRENLSDTAYTNVIITK